MSAARQELERLTERVRRLRPVRSIGRVERLEGMTLESSGPSAAIGELCELETEGAVAETEVVGFDGRRLFSMSLDPLPGLRPGQRLTATGRRATIAVGRSMLGRVIDGSGRPLDGGTAPVGTSVRPLHAAPPPAMQRRPIDEPMGTGVRVLDALVTTGRGQRVGIFAGSGVGKSTLLGMIARNADADVIVIALVGERGREVREFIESCLGPSGLKRSVVVVSTSDESPLRRIRAALAATAIAEQFRDDGAHVMLLVDSVTRVAMARREVALAVGEIPTARGYPPSVLPLLTQLFERAGVGAGSGTITGYYTVLVEADDVDDPIGDACRSLLDGHVVLSRAMTNAGQFPPVDPLISLSRLASTVAPPEVAAHAARLREQLAVYAEAEDLIRIGAYREGTDPAIDRAMRERGGVRTFLGQGADEATELSECWAALAALGAGPPEADG